MNFAVIGFFVGLVALSCAQKHDEILRNDFETPDADGTYKWAIQTEGGIYHEQRGTVHDVEGTPSLVVEGQYQYTAPDGQVINVVYRADENGFHAEGDHLPTPPPAPRVARRTRNSRARSQRVNL